MIFFFFLINKKISPGLDITMEQTTKMLSDKEKYRRASHPWQIQDSNWVFIQKTSFRIDLLISFSFAWASANAQHSKEFVSINVVSESGGVYNMVLTIFDATN